MLALQRQRAARTFLLQSELNVLAGDGQLLSFRSLDFAVQLELAAVRLVGLRGRFANKGELVRGNVERILWLQIGHSYCDEQDYPVYN